MIIFIIFFSFPVQAHPGRTDANGGHYVRTSGWGYPIGSYHYHNVGSAVSSNSSTDNKQTVANSNKENGNSASYWIIGFVGFMVIVSVGDAISSNNKTKKDSKKSKIEKNKELQQQRRNLKKVEVVVNVNNNICTIILKYKAVSRKVYESSINNNAGEMIEEGLTKGIKQLKEPCNVMIDLSNIIMGKIEIKNQIERSKKIMKIVDEGKHVVGYKIQP